jgi:hypothetical protein
MRQKLPLLRYRLINKCLRNPVKRYWSNGEILRKFGEHDLHVDIRTLRRDIKEMRHDERLGFNAPIKFCRRNGGYYYEDENFTIDIAFGPKEIEALRTLMEFIKKS